MNEKPDETATIHYMENSEFDQKIQDLLGGRYSRLRLKLSRGFTDGREIFLRERGIDGWIGRKRLILHEFGHLFNLDHTFIPNIMNPTWVFRWFSSPEFEIKEVN